MSLLRSHKVINGVLLDITGVLKDGGIAIPGSVEAVRKLQEAGLPIRLVTNETQVTRCSLASNLAALGFIVKESDIIPPCPSLVKVLVQENLRPHLLVHPDVLPEFNDIDQNNPNCVVIGDAADKFTYENLNNAFRALMNMENPRLFSLGRGRYYKEQDGLMLDVGAFTAALEYAADIKAEVVGKPQQQYFQSALLDMRIKPEEAVMVGDDLISDIGGAQKCGLVGVLVRTGKFRPTDENHPLVQPDVIVDNLEEAVKVILQIVNKI